MCELFGICRSAYYRWADGGTSSDETQRENAMLKDEITKIHKKSRETYGLPRVMMALTATGHQCGKHRVRRLMREEGLIGQQKKRFKPYSTDSDHGLTVAPNHLADYGAITRPDEVWAADITYIKVQDSWIYLAAVLDMYSRKIVGWSMSTNVDTCLVVAALRRALKTRQAPKLHHSDRGSQYASKSYQDELKAYGVTASMSRSGNPYDNATMESFFGTLKAEEVRRHTYHSGEEARDAIFSYIEAFYNTNRIHTSIGGRSPQQAEKIFCSEEEPSDTVIRVTK
jgi:putative transposase